LKDDSGLPSDLLDVRHLNVTYHTPAGSICAVCDLSLTLDSQGTLAIVGETGCGKSTLALSLMGLLDGRGCHQSGQILFEGRDLALLTESEWRQVRGSKIGVVFQDPRNVLNPVLNVGTQLIETLRAHQKISRRAAREKALRILSQVGVPDPPLFMRRFPSQLSGGLCQRIGIAQAICQEPVLLIADEPTSALDPTIQAQILALLERMKQQYKLALLLISHDLALVSMVANRVAVMYGGRLIESGEANEIFACPAHPYTRALLECLPTPEHQRDHNPLRSIPGAPGWTDENITGCIYAPRCPRGTVECKSSMPNIRALSQSHWVACIRTE
jgi:oligopeptide/dipeptide ABC transporter ATP-binding protein